jgi:hypothetical protein
MHTKELVKTIKGRSFREPDTAGGEINCDGGPEDTITTHCFKEKTDQATFLGPFQVATRARDVIHNTILHGPRSRFPLSYHYDSIACSHQDPLVF